MAVVQYWACRVCAHRNADEDGPVCENCGVDNSREGDGMAGVGRARVSFNHAELIEVEWSLRQRLDAWDNDDEAAHEATERAHAKVHLALEKVEDRAR